MRPAKTLMPVLFMYAAWILGSFLLYHLPRLLPIGLDVYPLSFTLATLFFVLLALLINVVFLVYAEGHLGRAPVLRFAYLLLSLGIAVGLSAAARHFEIKATPYHICYTANLLVFANLLGTWIIHPLKRQAELIIICLVMALADLFSIIHGPTSNLMDTIRGYYESGMKGPPPVSDFLLIKIPVPGLAHLQPLFGVSDWIIVVFLSAAAARFHINDNLTGRALFAMAEDRRPGLYFPVAAAALVATLFAAAVLRQFIPALPVIAVVFATFILIQHPSSRQLIRSDWLLMALFTAIMLTLLVLAKIMTA